ncbi:MAG: translation elongation factor Ts [Simkaniaceae bacterium]
MSKVTPALIKELRDRTSVGMGKCKQALEKAEGDIEKAIEILRKEGMASAVKKESRETKEGMISVSENKSCLAIIEVNAETDFVIQNDLFKEYVSLMTEEVLATKPSSVEAFLAQKNKSDGAHTNDELRAQLIQRIGENIQIKRLKLLDKQKNHSYGTYIHAGGRIACIADIEGASDQEALAREIAMHIAAEAPDYLDHASVPAEMKAKEEEIAKSQVPGNKPPEIIEKIVSGKVKSVLDSLCLINQKYVKDPSMTVEKFVASKGKDFKVASFLRWQIGQ